MAGTYEDNFLLNLMEEDKNKFFVKVYNIPVIYYRSYFNSNRDLVHYPRIEPDFKYKSLFESDFVKISCEQWCYQGVTSSRLEPDFIEESMTLDWNNSPTYFYDERTMEDFNRHADLEFKNVFLLHKMKTDKYPRIPISGKLFDVLVGNYLNNLVFTRWLYHDLFEFKAHVTSQKKKKRDKYKKN